MNYPLDRLPDKTGNLDKEIQLRLRATEPRDLAATGLLYLIIKGSKDIRGGEVGMAIVLPG
jgi:hypothetical protein